MPVRSMSTHPQTPERLESYGQGALKPWGCGRQQMLSLWWAHTLTLGTPQSWSGVARFSESCLKGTSRELHC